MQLFAQKIRNFNGKGINVTRWYNYYGYDMLGLIAFSKEYNMLESTENHWVIDRINEAQATVGPFGGVSWFILLINSLPYFGRFLASSNEWARSTIRERAAVGQNTINL